MTRLRYSDLSGALGGALAAGDTAGVFASPLAYADGQVVPSLAGGDDFLLSILTATGESTAEVVKVTAYDSGTRAYTIARAQEGYAAKAHAAGRLVTQSAYPSDLAAVGGGGGGGGGVTPTTRPLVDPTVQSWSWVNQGIATIATQGKALVMQSAGEAADSWHLRAKAVPAKPYSVIIHHVPTIFPVNYMGVGFGWRNSANGNLVLHQQRGGAFTLDGGYCASGFALTASYGTVPIITPFEWFKLTDDSTTRKVYVSRTGYDWMLLDSRATNSNVTPDQLVFGLESRNAGLLPVASFIDSWEEGA